MRRKLYALGMAALFSASVLTGSALSQTPSRANSILQDMPGRTAFIENKGQWDGEVRYLMQMKGMNAWITDQGITYDFHVVEGGAETAVARKSESLLSTEESKEQRVRGHVVKMKFERADGNIRTEGRNQLEGYCNYFLGSDQSKWASYVGRYGEVEMDEVYEGIDMRLYTENNFMRYDLIVEPGADPRKVVVSFEGSNKVQVNKNGELVLTTSVGDIVQQKLFAYQDINGKQQKVECRFAVAQDNKVQFVLGAYDTRKPLVIDPLVYSTFLGGSNGDDGSSIAVDGSNMAYMAGSTRSSNYPTQPGSYSTTYNNQGDVVVTKLNATGSALIYSTFIGGSDQEYPDDIKVDGNGNVYITGFTYSGNYPTTLGAFQTTHGSTANTDVFVTKLNSSGSALSYSTFIGGSSADEGWAIAVNSLGQAFVTGTTLSPNFPVTSGAWRTTYNKGEAFVVRLNTAGSAPIYSTFLGGSKGDGAYAIAVDGSNNAYIGGSTASTDFATTPGAYSTVYGGGTNDGFVVKMNAAGNALVYSTFIGGSSGEAFFGIAIDATNAAYVTGYTFSSNYPTTSGAFSTTYSGSGDAVVTKLNAAGSARVYSTFLGPARTLPDSYGIAVNTAGNAYIVGTTMSAGYVTTPGAHSTTLNGSSDAFVTLLNSSGSSVLYSTFIGGSGYELGSGIAIDASGAAYITGLTSSSNYPTVAGSFDLSYDNNDDAFVTKLTLVAGGSLSYSTYVGGSSLDEGRDIAIDAGGHAYITGFTKSMNYPTTVGSYDQTLAGLEDAFITKLNSTGTALIYSTYIGGDDIDNGFSIALDKSNNAYITGRTASWNFPTTAGCYDNTLNGLNDAFVLKLNATGAALVYSTFIGGNDDDDIGYGIAVDDLNRACITGVTYSVNFPTFNAYDAFASGASDAFLVGFDAFGASLRFSTFLGGSANETGEGIAIDPSRNIYLTGYTNSSDYPTTPGAFDASLNDPGADAFITIFDPSGTTLTYSTYLGGTLPDHGYDIALGPNGAYVTGFTQSTNFPVTSAAYDRTFNGWTSDVFVTKLDLSTYTLGYSTYIGGNQEEIAYGIAVDSYGAALVTGYVNSTNYPTTVSGYDASFNGSYDVFVSKLNKDGSHMIYSTYLGGSSEDRGYGIAVNPGGDAFVTGWTESVDFPTTAGAWDQTYNGLRDAFVTKLPTSAPDLVVNSTVFLEGPYSGGSMSTALNTLGYLPLTDPDGTVGVGSIPSSSIVDWVRVELRSTVDPTHIITAKSCFLRNDGVLLDINGTAGVKFNSSLAPNGSYYLVVNHRNHLAIMSASPIALTSASAMYNFTTAQSQAYMSFQNPMNAIGTGVYGMVAADVDRNGVVNAVDRADIINALTLMGYNDEDADMNGTVDMPDDTLGANNAFRATQVP